MRRWLLLLLLVVVTVVPSCASAMPNTAKVLEPKGFEHLCIGIAADVEMWFDAYNTYGVLFGLFLL